MGPATCFERSVPQFPMCRSSVAPNTAPMVPTHTAGWSSLTLTKEPDFRAAKMHDTIMVGPCHQTFIQTHRMHSTGEHPPVTVAAGQWLHGHTGSWLSQMHSGGDVVGGGGCACWGRGSWEISVLSTQFCCDPKISLKKSSLKKGS